MQRGSTIIIRLVRDEKGNTLSSSAIIYGKRVGGLTSSSRFLFTYNLPSHNTTLATEVRPHPSKS
ncbi:hypothetical protein M413DRAFT_148363 [Hebeloma cylindrosporum]|uniref:Uncharacterized protein n=1 Tax=Hebeloma cylindrosporum TaxID=76867 RepID=A0A0C2YK49_HEBCY|nr:hypothetical protein M413DRAFT_148363 [Hebeloma cylindrosporum h7]